MLLPYGFLLYHLYHYYYYLMCYYYYYYRSNVLLLAVVPAMGDCDDISPPSTFSYTKSKSRRCIDTVYRLMRDRPIQTQTQTQAELPWRQLRVLRKKCAACDVFRVRVGVGVRVRARVRVGVRVRIRVGVRVLIQGYC
jgi:hypothetical protein